MLGMSEISPLAGPVAQTVLLPDHYEILGLAKFEENPSVIVHAVKERLAELRSQHSDLPDGVPEEFLRPVTNSAACLLNALRKRIYDVELRRQLQTKEKQNRRKAGDFPGLKDPDTQTEILRDPLLKTARLKI